MLIMCGAYNYNMSICQPKLCFQMLSRFSCMYIIPVFPKMVNFSHISFPHSMYLDLVYHTMLPTADFLKNITPRAGHTSISLSA